MPDNVFFSAFEAEPSLIGCLLVEPSAIADVVEVISADDFTSDLYRSIFQAALRLWQEGGALDPVSIRRAAGVEDVGHLAQLMELTATTTNAAALAREVRNASLRRQLFQVGETLREAVAMGNDPQEAIAEVQKALAIVDEGDTRRELLSPADQMLDFLELRNGLDTGTRSFVPTGFRRLDGLLGGGMLCGGLYILAARPAVGKSSFALAVAEHIAANVGPVLFVSLEMDPAQLTAKRISREIGVPSNHLLMGDLKDGEYDRVTAALLDLEKRPLHINRKATLRVSDVDTLARRVLDLKAVVVDYMGLLKPEDKRGTRYEEMTAISGSLKALARRRKVPVLCLAQLNRANVERKDKRPLLSDLRDTGAIEQDADGVLFLHREDYYAPEKVNLKPSDPVPLDLILAKNRHAGVGTVSFAFYPATNRFAPATVKWKASYEAS